MARPPERASLEDVRVALAKLVGAADAVERKPAGAGVDLVLQALDVTFVVEWKAVGDAANVGSAVRQLASYKGASSRRSKLLVPIVAVPFMGETGRGLCAEAGVSWLDLSGNAWIDAPGRQIRILGHRNRFASAGRPANVFAPKSSRVVRALLMQPARAFSQAELVAASGVDKGRVSRLVRRLETMGLVQRVEGAIRVSDPSLMLDAWREAYDFDRHDVRRGHVAVRDAEELIRRIAESSKGEGISWALTGLAAAWQLTRFASYRLTTVFFRAHPPDSWLHSLDFRDEPRGSNLWLVRPIDDAVFDGAQTVDGVPCVHPLQVFLDLKAQPERAPEAADELRKRFLREVAA